MRPIEELRQRLADVSRQMRPIHPGVVLKQEFLDAYRITQNQLAVDLGVPPRRINEIIHGLRRMSVDTAVRLEAYFGLSASFWLNLQARYDAEDARARLGTQLDKIQRSNW